MTTEFIFVGTELLLGNIVNTNAQYLSQKCAELGLSVYFQEVVGDNERRLLDTIQLAVARSEIIILTGGLGPTEDDLTKETVAKAFHRKLIQDQKALDNILSFYSRKNQDIPRNNYKQAEVIEDSVVLYNADGTAPGMIVEEDGISVILLPGPPHEMKLMFREQVFPYLRTKTQDTFFSKMVKITGIGESAAEMLIKDMIDSQTNPTIAPYAKPSEVNMRLTASAKTSEEADQLIQPVVNQLYERFGNKIFTTDENETLAMVIVKQLREKNLTISLAESITGGLIAKKITDCPGSSVVLERAYVTYSDKAKILDLQVPKSTIDKFGVVSAETAEAMAIGLYEKTKADITLGITGIAGPDGGTETTPVGTVYLSIYFNGITTIHHHRFTGKREKIREYAAIYALDLIRRTVGE